MTSGLNLLPGYKTKLLKNFYSNITIYDECVDFIGKI